MDFREYLLKDVRVELLNGQVFTGNATDVTNADEDDVLVDFEQSFDVRYSLICLGNKPFLSRCRRCVHRCSRVQEISKPSTTSTGKSRCAVIEPLIGKQLVDA